MGEQLPCKEEIGGSNPPSSIIFRDRFGRYSLLTGLEAPGHCFWCGAAVKKGRRYCSEGHSDLYYKHFYWPAAARWCLERYQHRCADCSETAKVAHHLVPLNGSFRLWNVLNRPENLVALCYRCHGKRHSGPARVRIWRGWSLSNGRVAWSLNKRLERRYCAALYLPPPGWEVRKIECPPWLRGSLGEFRVKVNSRV